MTIMKRKWLLCLTIMMCLGQRSELRCTVGECPDGWVKFRDHSCVKMFLEVEKTWPEAEAICRRIGRGSYLIKILDAADNAALADLLQPHVPAYKFTWIGLNDIIQEGELKWVGDPQVGMENFDKFITGEPNNFMGLEDCVGFSPYYWNDFRCDGTLKFICQKPLYNTV